MFPNTKVDTETRSAGDEFAKQLLLLSNNIVVFLKCYTYA